MGFTREIYWNVGHGVLIPMYAFAFLAIGVAAWLFVSRMRAVRAGQSLSRTDNLGSRISRMIGLVLSQSKVMRPKWPGIFHAVFFWGFLVLFIGTLLVFLQADFTDPLFGVTFLEGPFYLGFSVFLDVAGALALIGLGALFIRRYVMRPEGLETKWDDAVMHGLMFVILLTGFFIEGARMAVTEIGVNPYLAAFSPVGRLFAGAFSGMDEAAVRSVHASLWWGHLGLVGVFFITIPLTKFRHIITSPANYLLHDENPGFRITTLDLEDESAESFGAAQKNDLTWKDLFDADACTRCKRCQDRCPAHRTDKPLSPMLIVNRLQDAVFGDRGEMPLADLEERDALWACTTCRACMDICPVEIEHIPKIVEMRRNLVLMEGEFPGDEVTAAMEHTEVNANPLGMPFASRGDWAKDVPGVVDASSGEPFDVLWFVGCYASFDARNIAVAKAFAASCHAAGITLGILGKDEKCCGEPQRKMGNEYLYQMMAAENIENMNAVAENASMKNTVVTTCPHCFTTLGREYPDMGFDGMTVVHHAEFLKGLMDDGRLSVTPEAFDCTFHDSCYLGRHANIYDAPRSLITASGGSITEMSDHRADSFCCGAGGGRILAEEKIGTRISGTRVKMANETGTGTLVSACPFCLTMFEDGVKAEGFDETITPRDIAEVIAARVTGR